MSNRVYKTVIVAPNFVYKYLEVCCKKYMHTFNRALDIQFEKMTRGLTHTEQLMDIESLWEQIGEHSNSCHVVLRQATEASLQYFHKWWHLRMSSNQAPMLPSYMKSCSYFKISANIKVLKWGYVYLPKCGRIKLQDSSYIPAGSYKNISVERKCGKWYISMEAVTSTEEVYSLHGRVEVHIDHKGNVFFGNKFYPNVMHLDNYRSVLKKLKRSVKKLKKVSPKSTFEISKRRKISMEVDWLRFRKENLKISYFQQITRSLVLLNPAELTFIYNDKNGERQSFSSQFFKDSDTLTLMRMIQRKLMSMGTKTYYSENIKEVVRDELNFELKS